MTNITTKLAEALRKVKLWAEGPLENYSGDHPIAKAREALASYEAAQAQQAEVVAYRYCYQGQEPALSFTPQDVTIPTTCYWQEELVVKVAPTAQEVTTAVRDEMAKLASLSQESLWLAYLDKKAEVEKLQEKLELALNLLDGWVNHGWSRQREQKSHNLLNTDKKPCRSPYCECEKDKCTHPGFYDARGT